MAEEKLIPCGGCGATNDRERCLGCMHDFGSEESAWVRPSREELSGEWATKANALSFINWRMKQLASAMPKEHAKALPEEK